MKPTASYLAKHNQLEEFHFGRFLRLVTFDHLQFSHKVQEKKCYFVGTSTGLHSINLEVSCYVDLFILI